MQGTEDLDVRVAFADIRQTDGNFHASIAKNTSHRFGMECIDPQDGDLREHVLVNLDCDIILPPSFAESVLSKFTSPTLQLLCCRGSQPATTGRIAIRASAYAEINGHDQEPGILGSGYQDVDLCGRVKLAPFAHDGSMVQEEQKVADLLDRQEAKEPAVAGWALPNTSHDYATWKDDRQLAKIQWVHNPDNLSWYDMNQSNRKAMLDKRGLPAPWAWKRNWQFSQLGWPFMELPREYLQPSTRSPGGEGSRTFCVTVFRHRNEKLGIRLEAVSGPGHRSAARIHRIFQDGLIDRWNRMQESNGLQGWAVQVDDVIVGLNGQHEFSTSSWELQTATTVNLLIMRGLSLKLS
ncbi:hypothetical protein AK812_SmicGene45971 [Symbiodinium microadriaticum]|uniref:Uncharacterized protein n=1 Tax=Symbiodinium microadriaticum TaxID=2951 RepID=A0A1Q9BUZ2_SYMMI|nr:hypothetical protein AK812_SmicGene45971 [Symbiodinium microadriaticum]